MVVISGLLVGGDRLALTLTEQAVAKQLQSSAELGSKPDVDISGFPFLTQAVSGRYDKVHVAATDVPTGGVRVADLQADLRGLEVPLRDALSGSVMSAAVQGLTAEALVSYADLSRQSGSRRLTVSRSGDRVAVSGSVVVLGRQVSATAISSVRLTGSTIVVRAEQLRVGGAVASSAFAAAIGTKLDLRVTVGRLPYGLVLDGLHVGAAGVALTAAAQNTVLTRAALS